MMQWTGTPTSSPGRFSLALGAREKRPGDEVAGTLPRNVACFRLRSGLAMWFVHKTLPLSLNLAA